MRYETPQAFERALSDRLKRQAAEEGVDLDRASAAKLFRIRLSAVSQCRARVDASMRRLDRRQRVREALVGSNLQHLLRMISSG